MPWYQSSKTQRPNYEEKIIRGDAERYVRRLYHLRGDQPTEEEVGRNVERMIKRLIDKYGSIINIRVHLPDNKLENVLDEVSENIPY